MKWISVPATSANLGVGFDCLGVALDHRARIAFEKSEQLQISGCKPAFCHADNLIYQAYQRGMAYLQEPLQKLHIHVESNIPDARGLGSSAICIVAGLAGANAMCGNRMNKYELFQLAAEMEGHADNVAPAIFGGLCASFQDEDGFRMIRYGIHPSWYFVSILPDYAISTKKARALLPRQLSYADAIAQMGRCMAVAKGIEIGNGLIVSKACHDKMHEPYRQVLIPEYADVKKQCVKQGAAAMCISGSGPSMLALLQDKNQAESLQRALQAAYPKWQIWLHKATYDGVKEE